MQKFFYERSPVWDYILMLVGTALIAVSIQCVYDPVSMVTGGFTGLAIIIKDVTGYLIPGGIPLWLTNLVLNVPLFLAALKIKGKRFIWRTIVGTLFFCLPSTWLNFIYCRLWILPMVIMYLQQFLAAVSAVSEWALYCLQNQRPVEQRWSRR